MLNYSTNNERAESTLEECRQVGSNVLLVEADVSKASSVEGLFLQVVERFGSVDVLVNNAARVIDKPVLDMTEGALHMHESGGVIINVGASTGIRGRRNGANTCASKAGLMVLTHCLALELAPHIRVNTVVPGLTLTAETEERFGLADPAARRAREDLIPMGRIGQPDDVADAVMLLLTDEATFITGQRVVVDGGQNMW